MDKKVLLVDDEVEIVDFLERFLKRFDIESIKAISGEQALDLYNPDVVGFVFLDIKMGGITGLEVLERLKQRNSQVKVFMITGQGDADSRDAAQKLGATDYITKPLDLGELKDKINKHMLWEKIIGNI